MATKTEEVEWVTYIKPISLPSCSNFNTSSLTNLISGVVKRFVAVVGFPYDSVEWLMTRIDWTR